MAAGKPDVNSNTPAGGESLFGGGISTTDVRPVWETEALPGWVNYFLIPLLASGQSWPKASESELWKLRVAYMEMRAAMLAPMEPTGDAIQTISDGWNAPAKPAAFGRITEHYDEKTGLLAKAASATALAQKVDSFARETQYTKISVNVAFWITIIAIGIGLIAAAANPLATAMVGVIAKTGSTRIALILQRLVLAAGRPGARLASGQVSTLASGSLRNRLVGSALFAELVEEIGEEGLIDGISQWWQKYVKKTRDNWDWNKTKAAIVGAGAGAVIGTKLGGPMSRLTGNIPGIRQLNRRAGDDRGFGNAFRRFPGRALNTGLNNTIASPAGSVIANGLVYGNWSMPTAESFYGGFAAGAARTGSIAPTNLSVINAGLHPVSTLANVFADAMTGGPTPGSPGSPGSPGPGDPTSPAGPGGRSPDTPPAAAQPPTTVGAPPSTTSDLREPAGAGPRRGVQVADTPNLDPSGTRDNQPRGDQDTSRNIRQETDTEPDELTDTNPADQEDGQGSRDTRATPETQATPETRTTPDPQPTPDDQSAQNDQSTPQAQATPETQPAPDTQPTPDQHTASDDQSTPDAKTAQDEQTAPDEQVTPDERAADTAPPAVDAQNAQDPATDPATDPDRQTTTADTVTPSAVAPVAPVTDPGRPDQPARGAALVTRWLRRAPNRGDYTTVTARPIPGSRFVAGNRPRNEPDLTVAEARAIFNTEVVLADLGVNSWQWVGPSTLVIQTDNGPQHFRVQVGRIRGRRARNMPLGRTRVRQGTRDNPHRIRLTPRVRSDQVARLLIHEITDTFHAQAARRAGAHRHSLPTRGDRDECLSARLREHAFLTRKLAEATSDVERLALQEELDALGDIPAVRALLPATPPPALPAAQNPRTLLDELEQRHAAVAETRAELRRALRDQITALDQAAADTRRLASAAYDISLRLSQEAATALANGDVDLALTLNAAAAARQRTAEAYDAARGAADAARSAFEHALDHPGDVAALMTAQELNTAYRLTIEETLPYELLSTRQTTARELGTHLGTLDRAASDLLGLARENYDAAAEAFRAQRHAEGNRLIDVGNTYSEAATAADEAARAYRAAKAGPLAERAGTLLEGNAHEQRLRQLVSGPLAADPTRVTEAHTRADAAVEARGQAAADLRQALVRQADTHDGTAERQGEAELAYSDAARRASERAAEAVAAGDLTTATTHLNAAHELDLLAEAHHRVRRHAAGARAAYERAIDAARALAADPDADPAALAELISRAERRAQQLAEALADAPPPAPPGVTPSTTHDGAQEVEARREETRALIAELTEAESRAAALQATHEKQAADARENAREAIGRARTAAGETDRSAPNRVRDALAEADTQNATAKRHERRSAAHAEVQRTAAEARVDAQTLLGALTRGTAPSQEVEQACAASTAKYRAARAAAAPPRAAHPGTLPEGGIANLAELTKTINTMLTRAGVAEQFEPEALARQIRRRFRRVIAEDGALLRLRLGSGAEVELKLRLEDLTEVVDPSVVHSETMIGQLPQGGGSVTGTHRQSRDITVGVNSEGFSQWLPGWTQYVILKADGGRGRSMARNTSAEEFALLGGVEDNRGEATLFEGKPTWEVRIRTDGSPWAADPVLVTGDERQQVWVSHAYLDDAPPSLTQLPEHERGRVPFPEHVVTGLTGRRELTDKVADRLNAMIGDPVRDQVQDLIAGELPARLHTAVNDPRGLVRPITVDGVVRAVVRVHSEIRIKSARPVGTASMWHLLERLRVGFSRAGQSTSVTGTFHGSVTAGAQANPDNWQVLDDNGDLSPRVTAGYAHPRSTTESSGSGGTAIHPSVQRWAGYTQGYELEVVDTVIVEEIGKPPSAPITQVSRGLFRMPEPFAYRYGLQVDRAAIIRRLPDGTPVLRDDPVPVPPPGRLGERPTWMGPGQTRGVGPALVQEFTGMDRVRADVEAKLREMGVLAPLVNGLPDYSSDIRKRASQIANEQLVADQLSAERLETGFDQAAQEGIFVDLVDFSLGRTATHHTMRIQLDQDWDSIKFEGVAHAEVVVNLDIASDGSFRSESKSSSHSVPLNAGVGMKESDGTALGGIGGGYAHTTSQGHGSSAGNTTNQVTLVEGAAVAFRGSHTIKVDLLNADGTSAYSTEGEGTARFLMHEGLLPSAHTTEEGPSHATSSEALRRSTTLHSDLGELAATAADMAGVPRDSAAFHALGAGLNVRSLVAHPEAFFSDYRIGVDVPRTGDGVVHVPVSVRLEAGESLCLGVMDGVVGDINFTLGSHGTSASATTTHAVEGSPGLQLPGEPGAEGKVSRAGSTTSSIEDKSIWGRERLSIDTGKHYVFSTDVTTHLSAGTQTATLPGGTLVRLVSERDTLQLYANGEVELSLDLVSDAAERLLNGSLRLNPRIAVPFVSQYLVQLHEAQAKVPDGHTRQAFADRIIEQFTTERANRARRGDAWRGLLAEAIALEATPIRVAMPDHYQHGVGMSTFRRANMHVEGEPDTEVELLNQIAGAVDVIAPGALAQDTQLWRALFGDFAGKRWWGKIDNMLDPDSPPMTYTLRIGDEVTEELSVTVRAELGDAAYLGDVFDFGQILQDYLYGESSAGRTTGTSWSGGVNASNDDGAGTLNSDRSHSGSTSVNQQDTVLQRVAAFKDAEPEVRQAIKLTVEVRRTGKVLSGPREETFTLEGHVDRVIPAGMVTRAGALSAQAPVAPDPRPFTMPEKFATEGTTAPGLVANASARIRRRDLLGSDFGTAQQAELARLLTGNARNSAFQRMTTDNGYRVIRFPNGHGEVIDVWVRAIPSQPSVIAESQEDTEVGLVDRDGEWARTSTDRGAVAPVGLGANAKLPLGIGIGVTGRDQTGTSAANSFGDRDETSVFVKGKDGATSMGLRVDYEVRFEVRSIEPGQDEQVVRTVVLPHASTGTADVIMLDQDLADGLTQAETTPSTRPVWYPPSRNPATRPISLAEVVSGTALPELVKQTRAGGPILLNADIAGRPYGQIHQARLIARELGVEVLISGFSADPQGGLRPMGPDDGFAARLSTLPPVLIGLADQHGIDLRAFPAVPGTTLADQVRSELRSRGIHEPPRPTAPWPVTATPDDADWSGSYHGGTSYQGGTIAGRQIPGSLFVADGRLLALDDLTVEEARARFDAEVVPADFGPVAPDWRWVSEDTLLIDGLFFRFEVGPVAGGRLGSPTVRSGLEWDPHVLRLAPRVAPDQVARLVLHEITDVFQALTAPDTTLMDLSGHPDGRDHCHNARQNEYRFLSRKRNEATTQEERAVLDNEIRLLLDHVAGLDVAEQPPANRIDALLNRTDVDTMVAEALATAAEQPLALPEMPARALPEGITHVGGRFVTGGDFLLEYGDRGLAVFYPLSHPGHPEVTGVEVRRPGDDQTLLLLGGPRNTVTRWVINRQEDGWSQSHEAIFPTFRKDLRKQFERAGFRPVFQEEERTVLRYDDERTSLVAVLDGEALGEIYAAVPLSREHRQLLDVARIGEGRPSSMWHQSHLELSVNGLSFTLGLTEGRRGVVRWSTVGPIELPDTARPAAPSGLADNTTARPEPLPIPDTPAAAVFEEDGIGRYLAGFQRVADSSLYQGGPFLVRDSGEVYVEEDDLSAPHAVLLAANGIYRHLAEPGPLAGARAVGGSLQDGLEMRNEWLTWTQHADAPAVRDLAIHTLPSEFRDAAVGGLQLDDLQNLLDGQRYVTHPGDILKSTPAELRDLMLGDQELVRAWDQTHDALAGPLRLIVALDEVAPGFDRITIYGEAHSVRREMPDTAYVSPFGDLLRYSPDYVLTSLSTGQELRFPGRLPDLIARHGFYGDNLHHPRVEPDKIIAMFPDLMRPAGHAITETAPRPTGRDRFGWFGDTGFWRGGNCLVNRQDGEFGFYPQLHFASVAPRDISVINTHRTPTATPNLLIISEAHVTGFAASIYDITDGRYLENFPIYYAREQAEAPISTQLRDAGFEPLAGDPQTGQVMRYRWPGGEMLVALRGGKIEGFYAQHGTVTGSRYLADGRDFDTPWLSLSEAFTIVKSEFSYWYEGTPDRPYATFPVNGQFYRLEMGTIDGVRLSDMRVRAGTLESPHVIRLSPLVSSDQVADLIRGEIDGPETRSTPTPPPDRPRKHYEFATTVAQGFSGTPQQLGDGTARVRLADGSHAIQIVVGSTEDRNARHLLAKLADNFGLPVPATSTTGKFTLLVDDVPTSWTLTDGETNREEVLTQLLVSLVNAVGGDPAVLLGGLPFSGDTRLFHREGGWAPNPLTPADAASMSARLRLMVADFAQAQLRPLHEALTRAFQQVLETAVGTESILHMDQGTDLGQVSTARLDSWSVNAREALSALRDTGVPDTGRPLVDPAQRLADNVASGEVIATRDSDLGTVITFADGSEALRLTGRPARTAMDDALIRRALGLDGPAVLWADGTVYQAHGSDRLRAALASGIRDSAMFPLDSQVAEVVTFHDGTRAVRHEFNSVAQADDYEAHATARHAVRDGRPGIYRAGPVVVYEDRLAPWPGALTGVPSVPDAALDGLNLRALHLWLTQDMPRFSDLKADNPQVEMIYPGGGMLSAEDSAELRSRLAALRPEFERYGLADAYQAHLRLIGEPADGTPLPLSTPDPGPALVTDYRQSPWRPPSSAEPALPHLLEGSHLRQVNELAVRQSDEPALTSAAADLIARADAELSGRRSTASGHVSVRVPAHWLPQQLQPGAEVRFPGILQGVEDPRFLVDEPNTVRLTIRASEFFNVEELSDQQGHALFRADSRFKVLASIDSFGERQLFLIQVPQSGSTTTPAAPTRRAKPQLTEALRRHLAEHVEETDAGVWLRDPKHPHDMKLAHSARAIKAIAGTFYVDGHGNEDGNVIGETVLGADETAALLLNNPRLKPDDVILLGNCDIGAGRYPLDLARLTGHVVIAADSPIAVYGDGSMRAVNDDLGNLAGRGQLRIYLPGDPVTAQTYSRVTGWLTPPDPNDVNTRSGPPSKATVVKGLLRPELGLDPMQDVIPGTRRDLLNGLLEALAGNQDRDAARAFFRDSGWAANPLSPLDAMELTDRVAGLEAQFAGLGRADLHAELVAALDQLADLAFGLTPLLDGDQDEQIEVTEADLDARADAARAVRAAPEPDPGLPRVDQAQRLADNVAEHEWDLGDVITFTDGSQALHLTGDDAKTALEAALHRRLLGLEGPAIHVAPNGDVYQALGSERLAASVATGVRGTVVVPQVATRIEVVTFNDGTQAVRHQFNTEAAANTRENTIAAAHALRDGDAGFYRAAPEVIYEYRIAPWATADEDTVVPPSMEPELARRAILELLKHPDQLDADVFLPLTTDNPLLYRFVTETDGIFALGRGALSPADITELMARAEAMRPEFERLGLSDRHQRLMERLEIVARPAVDHALHLGPLTSPSTTVPDFRPPAWRPSATPAHAALPHLLQGDNLRQVNELAVGYDDDPDLVTAAEDIISQADAELTGLPHTGGYVSARVPASWVPAMLEPGQEFLFQGLLEAVDSPRFLGDAQNSVRLTIRASDYAQASELSGKPHHALFAAGSRFKVLAIQEASHGERHFYLIQVPAGNSTSSIASPVSRGKPELEGSLRTLYDEIVEETGAGIWLRDVNDEHDMDLADHVRAAIAVEGAFRVDGHGSPEGNAVGDLVLTAEQTAALVLNSPKLRPDDVILMANCHVGADKYALEVARKTGHVVIAADTTNYLTPQGDLRAVNPSRGQVGGRGQFRVFLPDDAVAGQTWNRVTPWFSDGAPDSDGNRSASSQPAPAAPKATIQVLSDLRSTVVPDNGLPLVDPARQLAANVASGDFTSEWSAGLGTVTTFADGSQALRLTGTAARDAMEDALVRQVLGLDGPAVHEAGTIVYQAHGSDHLRVAALSGVRESSRMYVGSELLEVVTFNDGTRAIRREFDTIRAAGEFEAEARLRHASRDGRPGTYRAGPVVVYEARISPWSATASETSVPVDAQAALNSHALRLWLLRDTFAGDQLLRMENPMLGLFVTRRAALSAEDIATLTARLAALRPEFERLGLDHRYRRHMDLLNRLGGGTLLTLASPDRSPALVPDFREVPWQPPAESEPALPNLLEENNLWQVNELLRTGDPAAEAVITRADAELAALPTADGHVSVTVPASWLPKTLKDGMEISFPGLLDGVQHPRYLSEAPGTVRLTIRASAFVSSEELSGRASQALFRADARFKLLGRYTAFGQQQLYLVQVPQGSSADEIAVPVPRAKPRPGWKLRQWAKTHVEVTDAGVWLRDPSSRHDMKIATSAHALRKAPGIFYVDGHGSPLGHRVGDRVLSAEETAALLLNLPNHDPSEVILLGNCRIGTESYADDLARLTGQVVIATDGPVHVSDAGNVRFSDENLGHLNGRGQIYISLPDAPVSGKTYSRIADMVSEPGPNDTNTRSAPPPTAAMVRELVGQMLGLDQRAAQTAAPTTRRGLLTGLMEALAGNHDGEAAHAFFRDSGWAANPLSPMDARKLVTRVADFATEFANLGRADLHAELVSAVGRLADLAVGLEPLLVGDLDEQIEVNEADLDARAYAARAVRAAPEPDPGLPRVDPAQRLAGNVAEHAGDRGDVITFTDGSQALRFTGERAEVVLEGALLRRLLGLEGPAVHVTANGEAYQTHGSERLAASVATGIRSTVVVPQTETDVEIVTFNDGTQAIRHQFAEEKAATRREIDIIAEHRLRDGDPGFYRAGPTVLYEFRITPWLNVDENTVVPPSMESELTRRAILELLKYPNEMDAGLFLPLTLDNPLVYRFVTKTGDTFTLGRGALSPEDVTELMARAEAMRPEFERLGMGDSHRLLMERLEIVVRPAVGDALHLGPFTSPSTTAPDFRPPAWRPPAGPSSAALPHLLQGDNLRQANEIAVRYADDPDLMSAAKDFIAQADAELTGLPHTNGHVSARVPASWIPPTLAPGQEFAFHGLLEGVDDPRFLGDVRNSVRVTIRASDYAQVGGLSGKPHHALLKAGSRFKVLAVQKASHGERHFFMIQVPDGSSAQSIANPVAKPKPNLTPGLRRFIDEFVEETPAGIWLRDVNDDRDMKLAEFVRSAIPVEGAFRLDGHGSPEGNVVSDLLLSAEQTADLVLASPDLSPGDVILMSNCHVADSYALDVAKRTGRIVIAADTTITLTKQGDMEAVKSAFGNVGGRGQLRVFLPDDAVTGRAWDRVKAWSSHRSSRDGTAEASARPSKPRSAEEFADLAAKGVVGDPVPLTHGTESVAVDQVRLSDGSPAVLKEVSTREARDAEHLGSRTFRMLGLNMPATHIVGEHHLLIDWLAGEAPAVRWHDERTWALPGELMTREAALMGLGDALISNHDRARGDGLRVAPNGVLAGFDHDKAFRPMLPDLGSPLTRMFFRESGEGLPRFAPNPLSPVDIEILKRRLERLRPEFEQLGRPDWYANVHGVLGEIAKQAAGTDSVVSSPPGTRLPAWRSADLDALTPTQPDPALLRLAANVDQGPEHIRTVSALEITMDVVTFPDGSEAVRMTGAQAESAEVAALVRQKMGVDGPPVHRVGEAVYQPFGDEAMRASIASGIKSFESVNDGDLELVTFNDGTRAMRYEHGRAADIDAYEVSTLTLDQAMMDDPHRQRVGDFVFYERPPLNSADQDAEQARRAVHTFLTMRGGDRVELTEEEFQRLHTRNPLIERFGGVDQAIDRFVVNRPAVSPTEMAELRRRLESLLPQLARRGLAHHHDLLMARLAHLEGEVDGTPLSLGSMDGGSKWRAAHDGPPA